MFAISIPFESLGHLYSRAIYATRHTRLQVVASLIGFVVTIGATLATVDALDIVAIPLGFAAGSAVRFVLLVAVLHAANPADAGRSCRGVRTRRAGRADPQPISDALTVGATMIQRPSRSG